ncbi:hypothetical protein Hypma_013703 [Hypsizygus marmoreus]|uniref:Uncharacterized protein n=1 Tax=Hypsizygus marmoreus TaxID=39966 RepID=A0A369JAX0_HYPMA|nr:hypothetical protein Hypma_013703 [Hypsizygus marmoreus]
MSDTESCPPSRKRLRDDALQQGPRKKARAADPLVHHGRHFGRTVHALCNVHAVITNGVLRLGELSRQPEESFTSEQRRAFEVFRRMCQIIPTLEDRLLDPNEDEDDAEEIAKQIQKGISSARSDDTKSLKGPILDWITPRDQPLLPPIARNQKINRGFHHEVTGALLCPVQLDWSDPEVKAALSSGELRVPGDHWPLCLYARCKFDPEDPWNGFLKNNILVSAYKHIFTSPSSVEKEPKATRSGNARIHGMTNVTAASIVYVATQARFALSSSSVFSRTDNVTDSERFYNSLLEFLEENEEQQNVNALLVWWNRQIFPTYSSARQPLHEGTALARFRDKARNRRAIGYS